MSKTETQSEALRLARLLESGCWLPVGHGDPIDEAAAELRRLDARVKSLEFSFNEWHDKTDWVQDTAQALELGMHRADVLRARIEALDAENKALRERLEIDPSHPIDGIAARDETIRLLDGQILALRARLEAPAAALAAPSAGWISVDVALPPKNTEMAIWFAESTIPSTGQYTGLRADPNGWSYPSENYLSPGEHPNHPEGGYPTVTHWMELHAPGAAQAKEGGA